MSSEFKLSLGTSILDLLFNLSQAYTPSFMTSAIVVCAQYIQIIILNITMKSTNTFQEPSLLKNILTYIFRPFTDPWEFFSDYELPSILIPCVLSAFTILILVIVLIGICNSLILREEGNFTTFVSAVLYYESTILMIPILSKCLITLDALGAPWDCSDFHTFSCGSGWHIFVVIFTVFGVLSTAICALFYGVGCYSTSITSSNFGSGYFLT